MKILIVGGYDGYETPFVGLGDITFDEDEFLAAPEDFGLLVFAGGEDVNPAFYGHTSPKHMCGYNTRRDVAEKELYDIAAKYNIKMTGICRGSQFLNVMAGGVMMHHITNHGVSHLMTTIDGKDIQVTSTHHQMCMPAQHGHIMAWSSERRSTVYYGDKDEQVKYTGREVESIYYPKENIFAVQFHPEYMNRESAGFNWYRSTVVDFLQLSEEEFTKKYLTKSLEATV